MKIIVFFLSKYMGKPKKNRIFAKSGGARKSHSPSILESKKNHRKAFTHAPHHASKQ